MAVGFDEPGVGFDAPGTGFDGATPEEGGGNGGNEVIHMAVGPGAVAQELFRATPPTLSLLTVPGVLAATGDVATDGTRWLAGIRAESEGCSVSLDLETAESDFPYWWTCPTGTSAAAATVDLGGVKAIGENGAEIHSEPYMAWVGFTCRPGSDARNAEVSARVRRKLEACLPAIVEHELWTGQVATLMAADTPYLADDAAADVIGPEFGYVTGLAEMEQALAESNCSGRKMIHAQRRVVTLWVLNGLVSLSPDRTHLLTGLGTVVVPGTGYVGTSPTGAAASYSHSWIYGTGVVRVFLGDPTVNQTDAGSVNRSTNDVELRAERPVVTAFDPCTLLAAEINTCDASCRGGS